MLWRSEGTVHPVAKRVSLSESDKSKWRALDALLLTMDPLSRDGTYLSVYRSARLLLLLLERLCSSTHDESDRSLEPSARTKAMQCRRCCCPHCYRRPLLFKSNLWKWFDQFHHNDIFGRSVQSQKTWNIALTFSRRHRHRRVTVMVMHWTSIQVQSVGLLLYFEPCPVLPCPIILRTLFLPVQRKAIKHRYRTIRCPPPPPTLYVVMALVNYRHDPSDGFILPPSSSSSVNEANEVIKKTTNERIVSYCVVRDRGSFKTTSGQKPHDDDWKGERQSMKIFTTRSTRQKLDWFMPLPCCCCCCCYVLRPLSWLISFLFFRCLFGETFSSFSSSSSYSSITSHQVESCCCCGLSPRSASASVCE